MSNTPQIAYVWLVGAAIVYGAIFSVNKLAAAAGTPPLAQGFWQSLGGGLLLLIILALKGRKLALGRRHLLSYLVIGALAVGVPMSLLTYAAPHLPGGLQTIVLALSPPLTYFLGMLARIERFRVLGLLGLAFGFAGVLIIIVGLGLEESAPDAWRWFALSLIAPMLFACSNLAAALLRPPLSSSLSMAAGMLVGSSAIRRTGIGADGRRSDCRPHRGLYQCRLLRAVLRDHPPRRADLLRPVQLPRGARRRRLEHRDIRRGVIDLFLRRNAADVRRRIPFGARSRAAGRGYSRCRAELIPAASRIESFDCSSSAFRRVMPP